MWDLLYLLPPFKPVANNFRQSFIYLGLESNGKEQLIWISRDLMGVCWVHFDEGITEDMKHSVFSIYGYTVSKDQSFRSFIPLQLQIPARYHRHKMLRNIIKTIIDNGEVGIKEYCIPRCAVFRDDMEYRYEYEVLSTFDKSLIADHIGHSRKLLSEALEDKKLLCPPIPNNPPTLDTIKEEVQKTSVKVVIPDGPESEYCE